MTRDAVYLQHIRDAIARIETYTAVGRDEFRVTPHWQDATIRQPFEEVIAALLNELDASA